MKIERIALCLNRHQKIKVVGIHPDLFFIDREGNPSDGRGRFSF